MTNEVFGGHFGFSPHDLSWVYGRLKKNAAISIFSGLNCIAPSL